MEYRSCLFVSLMFLSCVSWYTVHALTYSFSLDLSTSWSNCGPADDPVQLKSLTIAPDPIRVPGNITISGSANVGSQIPTDVHASVLLQRKVGPVFVKVPCVDKFGSCSYSNVCDLWAEFCPTYAAQYGLPCTCPIPADIYSVSNANIYVNKSLPSELLGEYRATVDVASTAGRLACIYIDLTIRH